MKANSDTRPETFIKSRGLTHFNFNIVETTREDMDGTKWISYDYDYVEIKGEVTRPKIIDAIISSVHGKDGELALINNELATPGTKEYKDYQVLRAAAKDMASLICGTPE